jgi:hypothetical protein
MVAYIAYQFWYLVAGIRSISVDNGDDIAFSMSDAGLQSGSIAPVIGMLKQSDTTFACFQYYSGTIIVGAIVHNYNLISSAIISMEYLRELVQDFADGSFLVIHGYYNGYIFHVYPLKKLIDP